MFTFHLGSIMEPNINIELQNGTCQVILIKIFINRSEISDALGRFL